MSKELDNVNRQIERLEKITKQKTHGKDSNELKILQQLSELYRKRTQLIKAVT